MTAPRWKDKLGRVCAPHPFFHGMLCVDGVDDSFRREVVEALVGPLEPVEERCRVRVACGGFFAGAWDDVYPNHQISPSWTTAASKATTWPRARAEEIAAACRVLGWEAVVEEVTS